jgi:UDP-glucuronate 4-epimerase
MSGRTVVITGAAGFIGSHLTRACLARGDRVVGIDNFDPFYGRELKTRHVACMPRDRFVLDEACITDPAAVKRVFERERPDSVFHLAALAGVRPSLEAPARFAHVNVTGTALVLEAARTFGCPRVVFASSSSVYGNNARVPFAESDAVDEPISPYAATKRAGELLAHVAASREDSPLRVACLRFFTVYGPAQRPDLAIMKFMRAIAANEPIHVYGDGTSSRDYTYIDDVIAGVLSAERAIDDPRHDGVRIWNLGGASPISLHDMIERLERVVGRRARIKSLPPQPGDVNRTFADLSRSRAELGFTPTTLFDDGLRRQWEWLRSQDC